MDPNEEKVVKLYITSIVSLIALVLVLGAVVKIQESNLASSLITASTQDTLRHQLP